ILEKLAMMIANIIMMIEPDKATINELTINEINCGSAIFLYVKNVQSTNWMNGIKKPSPKMNKLYPKAAHPFQPVKLIGVKGRTLEVVLLYLFRPRSNFSTIKMEKTINMRVADNLMAACKSPMPNHV